MVRVNHVITANQTAERTQIVTHCFVLEDVGINRNRKQQKMSQSADKVFCVLLRLREYDSTPDVDVLDSTFLFKKVVTPSQESTRILLLRWLQRSKANMNQFLYHLAKDS